MRKAASLYRLHLAIAFAGGTAVLLGLVVAIDGATTHQQQPGTLVSAVLLSEPTITATNALLLLALGAIVAGTLGFGLRATAVELRAQLHAAGQLRCATSATIAGEEVGVIADARPRAFCHGLLRPRIYVSRGALAVLTAPQLAALLAHERHHARRHDPLRFAAARILGGTLFFLPALPRLLDRYGDQAELAADEAAVRDGQNVAALAAVLLAFDERGAGVHPQRVDQLLGQDVTTTLPAAAVLATSAIIATVAGLGLVGAALNGHDAPIVVVPALLIATVIASVATAGRN